MVPDLSVAVGTVVAAVADMEVATEVEGGVTVAVEADMEEGEDTVDSKDGHRRYVDGLH